MSQSTYNATNDSQGIVEASTDLSSSLFAIIKETSTGIVLCGADERPCGVLINTPKASQIAKYIGVGPGAKIVCTSAITKGDVVASSGTTGGGKTITSGHWMIGFAKETGVAGDIIEIDVHVGYYA